MHQNPALPSNAGDRYHFIYVARKLLDLLYPRTTLARVEVEGVAEEDAAAEKAENLLGVDLTEYFGGDRAAHASRVEITQVKYSPTHPDEPWTVSRLTKRTSKNSRSSVIGRLAEAYETIAPTIGQDAGLGAKLVSNQPLDPEFHEKLKHFHETDDLDLAAAVAHVREASSSDTFGPLQEASGLDWPTFVTFLRALDLRDVGAGSLISAETDLFSGLDNLVTQADIYVGHLISEVQRAATPGQQRTFRKREVYALLRLFEESFQPAPTKLESVETLFATEDVGRVADAVRQHESGTLIVHGVGGTGKTSTLQVLARDYQSSMAMVLYDCFAGGEGLQAGRERFPARKFFTQLTNDLDALLHTNILATTKLERDRIIGLFTKAIEEATKIAASQGRRLVIAVDAADNAALQARRVTIPGEESFLPLLARLPLPANCLLVITARTENLADLGLTGDPCALTGFTSEETERHAQMLAPGVSKDFAKKLHTRTSGNPRVQSAILKSIATAAENEQDTLLEQRARATIFEYFADAFPDRVSARDDRLSVAVLFEVTQPVDIATAAAVLRRSEAEVRAIVQSLAFGLDLLPDQTVKWRDQDFWDYAREELASERENAKLLLARFCQEHFEDSGYARANVSRHLFDAGLLDELVDFWLSGERLSDRIRDAAPHNEGVLRDVSYALQAAATQRRRVDVLRLISHAADLAQGRTVFIGAMDEFPDVAVTQDFVDSYLAALHAEPQEEDVARRYIALAAALAEANHDTQTADDLRLRGITILRQPNRFNRELRFNLSDVENLAAHDTAADGLRAALENLKGWTPQTSVHAAYAHTVQRAGKKRLDVDAALIAAKLPAPARAYAALGALTIADRTELPHRDKFVGAVAKFFAKADGDPRIPQRLLSLAVEALMRAGDLDSARTLLPLWTPRAPFGRHDPDTRDFLRWTACGAVLNNQPFEPEKFRRPRDQAADEESKPGAYRPHDSELEELRSEMRAAYPALLARARAWTTRDDSILPDVRQAMPKWEERHWSTPPRTVANSVVADFLEAVLCAPSRDRDLVLQIVRLGEKELPLATRDVVRPAEILAKDDRYLRDCEDLIRGALLSCRPPAIGARDAVDRLLRLQRIARAFDANLATELFNTARLLAAGIDATIDARVVALLDTAEAAIPSGDVTADDLLQLAAVVEYGQQMDEESPESRMDRVLQLLGRHDGSLALAAARAWDEDDRLDIRTGVLAVSKGMAFRPDIPDGLLVAVVELAARADVGIELLEAISERRGAPARDVVFPAWSEYVLRQPGTERISHGEAFLARCEADGLGSAPVTAPVRTFLEAARVAGIQRPKNENGSIGLPRDRDQPPEPSLSDAVKSELAQSPARALAALHDASEKQLGAVYVSEAIQLFSAVAEHLPSSAIQTLLEAADRWHSASYSSVEIFQLLQAIAECAPAGSISAIREAGGRYLTTDTLRQLPHFFRAADAYPACRACWSGQPTSFFDAVVSGIAKELHEFDPSTLQLWIGRLSRDLSPTEAAALLRHILPPTFHEIPNPRELEKPPARRADEALAHALCDCLGHPRRDVRWHAVHAIATAVEVVGPGIIPLLVSELADVTHARWMTKREWLLFTFEHLSFRSPKLLVSSLGAIAASALDPNLPHAKIRHHARATCLRVDAAQPGALQQETRDALEKVNQPIGFTTEKKATGGLPWRRSGREERPFYINDIDTVPYWYDRVADCFNLTSRAFTDRAYHWIIDQWHITDDLCHEEVKKKHWDWRQTSNDHGSEPSIETLEKYAERHAMFMVAGELIDSKPVAQRDRFEDEDKWRDWSRYTLRGADPSLPARLLVPPPLDSSDNYGVFAKDFDAWQSERPEDDFRREVLPPGEPDRLVVLGHREVRSGERDLTVRVHSALVSRATAPALVRAIQNHRDTYAPPYEEVSYAIIVPELEDELRGAERYSDDDDQTRSPFSLRRFVVYAHQELPLQGGDPRWRDWARDFRIPSKWVMEQLHLARPDTLQLAWNNGSKLAAESQLWYDGEDSEYPKHHAEGNRLLMRRDVVTKLMTETDCDVIVTVTIQRQRSYDYRSRGQDEYDRGQTRAYLLSDFLQ